MDEKAASTSAVFTDDLVLPSRRQRFDILLRPRYWFLNVLALRLGLSLGKLLSRLLFPSINPPWNGWWDALLSTYDEAFKITFVCAILLLCAGLVWSYFVPDYSDSDRMEEREAAWKATINAGGGDCLGALKNAVDARRRVLHDMSDEELSAMLDAEPCCLGMITIDDAAAACVLLERRARPSWRTLWRQRGLGVRLV